MEALQIENSPLVVVVKNPCDNKLIVMAFISFVVNTGFSYILPFFPVLAHEVALLDYTLIGILMSINSVGSTLSAYIFGTRIQVWGRKRFFLISLFAQSLIMLLYGSLYFITSNFTMFLCISIFTRVFEGVVRSIYGVANFTYLNLFYRETFAQKFAIMETTASIGQISGFVLGSLLNYLYGYWVPLLGLAILFQICLLLAFLFIPADDMIVQSTEVKAKLPLNLALKHKETLITFLTLVVTRATLNYYTSFFSHHMKSYNQDQNIAALIISLPAIAYVVAIMIIPRILKDQKHFEFVQSLSIVVSFVGIGIISPVWSSSRHINHIYFGLVIMGVGSALNRIPAIPVLSLSIKKMNIPNNTSQGISDMASALFQMNLSVSNLIFPLVGGGLYDLYGGQEDDPQQEMGAFRFAMLTLMFLQMISFTLDLMINNGWKIWKTTFRRKNQALVESEVEGKKNESKIFLNSSNSGSENYSDTVSNISQNTADT